LQQSFQYVVSFIRGAGTLAAGVAGWAGAGRGRGEPFFGHRPGAVVFTAEAHTHLELEDLAVDFEDNTIRLDASEAGVRDGLLILA
jgi:hypothetical protein